MRCCVQDSISLGAQSRFPAVQGQITWKTAAGSRPRTTDAVLSSSCSRNEWSLRILRNEEAQLPLPKMNTCFLRSISVCKESVFLCFVFFFLVCENKLLDEIFTKWWAKIFDDWIKTVTWLLPKLHSSIITSYRVTDTYINRLHT